MSNDNPFLDSDADRTVIRPRPGARGARAPDPERTGAARGDAAARHADPTSLQGLATGLNPILASAGTLITLIAQLKNTANHPDPTGLFRDVSNELREFEATAQAKGEPTNTVLAARFILCTVIDEMVLNTPWGSRSPWMTQTLLSTFHNENWGGEKVFELLDRLLQDPIRNLHLLELIYVCISLGFEGKYRQMRERGRLLLSELRAHLYETIRSQRARPELALSPHWEGAQSRRLPLARYLPLWVLGSATVGVLVFAYLGFALAINGAAEEAFGDVVTLADDIALPAPDRPYVYVDRIDLASYLQPQLQSGAVQVTDVPRGQLVTLAGDGLFASGSAQISEDQVPTMLAVGEALARVSGDVLVVGHTDDVPSRSARYPSNLVLSEARANAVLEILATRVATNRLIAQGMGDARPVADNGTAQGRARNRRVEILLVAEAGRE
jgi:type VI secretion system protein ImpK